MVSTRGGAKTGADDTTKAASKPKATRGKTVQAAPKPTTRRLATSSLKVSDDGSDDELQEDPKVLAVRSTRRPQKTAEPEQIKPTRKGATRAKKDVEPSNSATAPKATTKTARNARRLQSVPREDSGPDLPPPPQSRATRGTRATEAKGKAPPLSPKKITQVSKAPPRTTRAAASKTGVNPASAKAATRGRPITRRRNISDENEDVLGSGNVQQELGDSFVAATKKASNAVTRSRSATHSTLEDESSVWTQGTTSHHTFDDTADLTHDSKESEDVQTRTATPAASENGSVDELMGAKTPMKRCSPREGSKYTSARKKGSVGPPATTPVRRFAILGTQQGTPQTEKPYRKPSAPLSEVGPTTVARARDRAMVFPKLQPLPVSIEMVGETVEDDEETIADNTEGSELPEDESTPRPSHIGMHTGTQDSQVNETDAEDVEHQATEDIGRESSNIARHFREEQTLQWPLNLNVDMEDSDLQVDGVEEVASQEEHPAEPTDCDHDSTEAMEVDTALVQPAAIQDSSVVQPDEASFKSADSVLVTRQETSLSSTVIMDESTTEALTPEARLQPETLMWENIREDVTIPFDFYGDLSMSRVLPQGEPTERLSIAAEWAVHAHDNDTAIPDTHAQDGDDFSAQAGLPADVSQELSMIQSCDSSRPSMDAAINLSDFINIESDPSSPQLPALPMEVQAEAVVERDSLYTQEVAAKDPAPSWQQPVTPAKDMSVIDVVQMDHHNAVAMTPRYAMPTIASRRKSVPTLPHLTPFGNGARPKTSDGASIPTATTPFAEFSRPVRPATATPLKSKQRRPLVTRSAMKPRGTYSPSKTPVAKTPGTSVPIRTGRIPTRTPFSRTLFARTPGTSVPETNEPESKERYLGLPPRETYEAPDSAGKASPLVAAPSHGGLVCAERFPGLPSRTTYEELVATPITTAARSTTPDKPHASTPALDTSSDEVSTPNAVSSALSPARADDPTTPQPATQERYPGLPVRRTYEEHAKTTAPASRFRTPSQSPAKRPATVKKPSSLRKIALRASTPVASRTPDMAQSKAPAMTPGQEPLTPHPAAPLRGVVALVEVFTSDGGCATPAFTILLQRLGAKTTKTFSERVTHVVFKEGSPLTLQRLRLHNKQVAETDIGTHIHCVNSRWVNDCDAEGRRVDEEDEAYAVDVEDVPRAGKRRRKSMEPMSLLNNGGNIVRDRKTSLGRSSLGRTPLRFESPSEVKLQSTPEGDVMEKENSGDDASSSPATPAYLSAPDSLVQQTAPLNRMKRMNLDEKEQRKNRRLTYFPGRA